MVVLFNNVWYRVVVGFVCASSRISWSMLMFVRVKAFVFVIYGLPEVKKSKDSGRNLIVC